MPVLSVIPNESATDGRATFQHPKSSGPHAQPQQKPRTAHRSQEDRNRAYAAVAMMYVWTRVAITATRQGRGRTTVEVGPGIRD